MVNIAINNETHETIGGIPAAALKKGIVTVAKGFVFSDAVYVRNFEDMDNVLKIP